jgi:serine/threonine protein kinase/class 3 adenylate cyclase
MGPQLASAQRLEEFQRQHRLGLVTLLFTDIVGSTQLKQQHGDQAAVRLIQEHHQALRDLLKMFLQAEEIETAGDSFLLVFARPSDAAKFALGWQTRLRELTRMAGIPLTDRIGIHVGEVFIQQNEEQARLFGAQVDICARVMSLAQGDQILLTRFAFDSARAVLKGEEIAGVGPLAWMNHGPYLLKGVEEPVEICEVGEAGLAVLKAPPNSDKAHRHISSDAEPVLGWRPALDQAVPNTKWTLEKKLGEGGFGEVWLGRHETLKEKRVFKFCFRADRVRSLKREVTLFRVLKERVGHHPNIVGIQEVFFDEPPFYIVMDYADGQDLRAWCETQGGVDKVPLSVRLEIVAQVADALQAAHEAGVIHRDVKPSNILVSLEPLSYTSSLTLSPGPDATSETCNRQSVGERNVVDGISVKLTDFGIGQVVSQEALAGMTQMGFTQTMLSPGSSSHTGTQLYMAPELIAGKPASSRSDIYSLGVVLHQLLVGDFGHPVTTDWAKRILDPLLREDLQKCFAGNPEERYVDVARLANDLRALDKRRGELAAQEKAAARGRIVRRTAVTFGVVAAVFFLALYAFKQGGGGGKELPLVRLAVLPLENLSGEVAQQYFADEVTDDLIGKLGQIRAVQVITRATTMKCQTNSVPEIARQLKVNALVKGTLKREQDRVRIEVRLFNGRTEGHLWKTNYERDVRDLFDLQDAIALGIASKLKVKVDPEERARLTKPHPVVPEALDLYYQGKARDGAGGDFAGDANNLEAIRLLDRVVKKVDKNFAPAWAALAGAYITRLFAIEPQNSKRWADMARDALLEALQLDPDLALAHESLGRLYWSQARDFDEKAQNELSRALQLNPSAVGALQWIGWVYNHTGFFDQALAKAETAITLDPRSTGLLLNTACSHLWKGEYEESLFLWPKIDPKVNPYIVGSHWAWALLALGETTKARATIEAFLEKHPEDSPGELTAMKAILLAADGKEADAVALIQMVEKKTELYFGETHHTTYFIACVYARLKNPPQAVRWLKQTAQTGFPCYALFASDPNLANLRTNPEFLSFLKGQETDWLRRSNLWFKSETAVK